MTGVARMLGLRLATWLSFVAVVVFAISLAPHGTADPALSSASACRVEQVVPYAVPSNPALIELTAGPKIAAILSLSSTTLTLGPTTTQVIGARSAWFGSARASHRAGRSTDFHLTNGRGGLSSMRYRVRIAQPGTTFRVSVAVKPTHAGVTGASVTATLIGFAPVRRHTTVASSRQWLNAPHHWAMLSNGRCSLVMWSRSLQGVHASRRPGSLAVADYALPFGTQRGAGTVNFTFLYRGTRAETAAAARRMLPRSMADEVARAVTAIGRT